MKNTLKTWLIVLLPLLVLCFGACDDGSDDDSNTNGTDDTSDTGTNGGNQGGDDQSAIGYCVDFNDGIAFTFTGFSVDDLKNACTDDYSAEASAAGLAQYLGELLGKCHEAVSNRTWYYYYNHIDNNGPDAATVHCSDRGGEYTEL